MEVSISDICYAQTLVIKMTEEPAYLDGCNMEGSGDTKDRHDHGLIFLINIQLHLSNLALPWHLRDVLIRHVRFPCPGAD